MLIECLRIRQGGTYAPIGDKEYRFFERQPGGPHVAEVTDPEHIAIFLAITAYVPAEEPAAAPEKLEPAQLVAPAAPEPPAPVDPAARPLEDMTDEEIDAAYVALFGRKPHWRAKRETIIADIIEKRAEG
ncbi:hypothetical protein EYE35_01145 [Cereibacter sphaeroides]|nr:hypothetical protein EYE35_01145 [Cereibacter sphaeroides]